MVPSTCQKNEITGAQQEEGHGVVHHVQWEHHQSYLLHPYQNARIQSIYKEYLNNLLGLTLSTPGLVTSFFHIMNIVREPSDKSR